ncbi:MAG: helix-turn-helix domain-containing protein [Campylobacterota bacterium]
MTFLKDTEVAEMINVSVHTLRTWRERGRGPKYIKAEGKRGAVRYELDDVLKWIEESRDRART